MSEKLDGVRCVWTGKALITRNGTTLLPPAFFTRSFPNSTLDGELYAGRQNYKRVVDVITSKSATEEDWLDLTFCVFDTPNINMQFSHRYSVSPFDPDPQSSDSVPQK